MPFWINNRLSLARKLVYIFIDRRQKRGCHYSCLVLNVYTQNITIIIRLLGSSCYTLWSDIYQIQLQSSYMLRNNVIIFTCVHHLPSFRRSNVVKARLSVCYSRKSNRPYLASIISVTDHLVARELMPHIILFQVQYNDQLVRTLKTLRSSISFN